MTDKTVASVQSSYIPWKGYFDLVNRADEFVLLDSVQFTRRDWRTRNRIKTPNGVEWLTIPVEVKNKYDQQVSDVRIADRGWARRHWETLRHNYARAACFDAYASEVEEWYREAGVLTRLSDVNHLFLTSIARTLGITTPFFWSADYPLVDGATARLVEICRASGATRYLSGPTAREYLDEAEFHEAGVEVEYVDYSGYPEYRQLHGEFNHYVTILDMIFNEGADAPRFMKSFSTP